MKFVIDKSVLTHNASIPLVGGLLTLNVQHSNPQASLPISEENTSITSSSSNSTINNNTPSTSSLSTTPPINTNNQCNNHNCHHDHHHHYHNNRDTQPLLHNHHQEEDNSKRRKPDDCCSSFVKCCQSSLLPGVVASLSVGAYLVGAFVIVPFAFPLFNPVKSTKTMIFVHILNQIVGLFELSMLLLSYFRCMRTNPGIVSNNWQESFSDEELKVLLSLEPQKNGEPRYCSKTGMIIPPRSHFSSVQKKVVLRMDHYCVWVNNCVGLYNHKYFYLFLTYLVVAITHFFGITIFVVIEFIKDSQNIDVAVFLLTLVFNVFLVPMSCMIYLFWGWNTYLILLNQTSIENYQLSEKRNRARMKKLNTEHLKYLNFYNISYLENVKQVMGRNIWKWPFPIPDNLGTDGFRYPTVLPYDTIIEMQKETFTHVLPDQSQRTSPNERRRSYESDYSDSDDEMV